jgi:hypothetical protein
MIAIVIIIGLVELGATYAIFYTCKKNLSYDKFMVLAKKKNSEECMQKIFSYIDNIKELHTYAIDGEYTIVEIHRILTVYIELIRKYQNVYLKTYTKYHTDKENITLYKILNAEHMSIVNPAVQYIKANYRNRVI